MSLIDRDSKAKNQNLKARIWIRKLELKECLRSRRAKKYTGPKDDVSSDPVPVHNQTTTIGIQVAVSRVKRLRDIEDSPRGWVGSPLEEASAGPTTRESGRPAKKRSRAEADAGLLTVVVEPGPLPFRSIASIGAEIESLKDKHEVEAEALKEKHRELEVGLERELGEAVLTEHLNKCHDAVAEASRALRLANAKGYRC